MGSSSAPSHYSATDPPLAPPGSKTDDEEHRLFSPCFAAYPRVGFPTRGTIRPTLRPDSADGKGDLRRQSYAVVPGGQLGNGGKQVNGGAGEEARSRCGTTGG
ncbi:uncharacterized protein [Gossypium hirsutum]|uniref:Uncharacterized protein n=1 Tax=Gossypium hirsutum TaxID=3635 RepID=A0ABM2ZF98_GOSHI|nr:uncharacterized protein LOC121212155 [Gossypium hirsutum]